ncbi:alpha/beta hydrolase domain-containing protein [Acrasis kona]|uniref:Alpha/beta hydrolase domain-containing protein n=1 Tax=Acrasis kona TaxID=1008807 RepID=A0AAW2ZGQ0_9EUKA
MIRQSTKLPKWWTLQLSCKRLYTTPSPVVLNFHEVHETGESENTVSPISEKEPTPVVVLHGLFGNSVTFRNILQKKDGILRGGRRAFVLDARNHGKSPHNSSITYEDMTQDLILFLKSRNIKKSILLGHSMGGKTILNTLLHHETFVKEYIEKSIVVDIAPMSYMNHPRWEVKQMLTAMESIPLERIQKRRDAEDHIKHLILDPKVRLFLLTNLVRPEEGENWTWKFNIKAIRNHINDVGGFPEIITNKKCAQKVLFVRGGTSFYVQEPEALDLIEKHFEDYKIKIVPNASHWVHTDNTPVFERVVRDLIENE